MSFPSRRYHFELFFLHILGARRRASFVKAENTLVSKENSFEL